MSNVARSPTIDIFAKNSPHDFRFRLDDHALTRIAGHGADTKGFAGLEDGTDYHWASLLKAAALSTLLGVGSEIAATGNQNDIVTALRRGGQDTLNQTGQQLVRREMNIQPTLTIRPGFPVRVIVNRDLVLAPYQG